MADVRKHRLRDAMLTVEKLRVCFDGRYTGTIESVGELEMFNHFLRKDKDGQRKRPQLRTELVLTFADDERAVCNPSMLKTLEALHGWESDAWVGQRVTIFVRQTKRVDKKTGEPLCERVLMGAAADAAPAQVPPLEEGDIDFNFGANRRR